MYHTVTVLLYITRVPLTYRLRTAHVPQVGHVTGLSGLTQLTNLGVMAVGNMHISNAALASLTSLSGLRQLKWHTGEAVGGGWQLMWIWWRVAVTSEESQAGEGVQWGPRAGRALGPQSQQLSCSDCYTATHRTSCADSQPFPSTQNPGIVRHHCDMKT